MFRLKATLVATTLMRPWRTGWSTDRGVDFSFTPTVAPVIAPSPTPADRVAAEPPCFIDEDWPAPADAGVARTFPGPAATEGVPGPVPEGPPDAAGLRAWWSVASKPART